MTDKKTLHNYYKILGVTREADAAKLRQAFAIKARAVHPDVSIKKEKARKKFMLLREAYDVLRDPVQRQAYDDLIDESETDFTSTAKTTPDARSNEYYKDEWEMFVNQPDEYLGLYETIAATASSGAQAVLSVVASTVFSILASFFAVTIIVWLGMALISFASAITFASVVGLLIVIITAANTIEVISDKMERLTDFFSSQIFLSLQKLPRIQARRSIKWIFAALLLACLAFAVWLNFAVYNALGYDHLLATKFFKSFEQIPLINGIAWIIGLVIDFVFFIILNAPMVGSIYINTKIFKRVLSKIGKPKTMCIKKPLQLGL
jgi:hypothetical protein